MMLDSCRCLRPLRFGIMQDVDVCISSSQALHRCSDKFSASLPIFRVNTIRGKKRQPVGLKLFGCCGTKEDCGGIVAKILDFIPGSREGAQCSGRHQAEAGSAPGPRPGLHRVGSILAIMRINLVQWSRLAADAIAELKKYEIPSAASTQALIQCSPG